MEKATGWNMYIVREKREAHAGISIVAWNGESHRLEFVQFGKSKSSNFFTVTVDLLDTVMEQCRLGMYHPLCILCPPTDVFLHSHKLNEFFFSDV